MYFIEHHLCQSSFHLLQSRCFCRSTLKRDPTISSSFFNSILTMRDALTRLRFTPSYCKCSFFSYHIKNLSRSGSFHIMLNKVEVQNEKRRKNFRLLLFFTLYNIFFEKHVCIEKSFLDLKNSLKCH